MDRADHRWLSRRRRSGSQLQVQVGGSTTSRQTATAADTLEIDMPTRHQGNTELAAVGGDHSAIVPQTAAGRFNRSKFLSP